MLVTTAFVLALLSPLGAEAQVFTVLPVERDSRVDSSERMAAFTAVQSARVLGPSAQFEPVGALMHRLPDGEEALADCLEVDCAARLARESGIDAVLVVAVWPGDDGRAASVAVTLVEPTGETHEADADVGDAGVASAATNAVVAAARRRTMGGGVELRVGSEPEGALVMLDGTEVGVTPFVGTFEAGQHEVEVRLHGRSESWDVELEEEAVTLDADLGDGEGGAGEGVGSNPATHDSHFPLLDVVVGGALILGGLVTLGVGPIQAAARSGEVTQPPAAGGGEPGQQIHFGAAAIALTVVSVALLAAGGVVLIVQPLTDSDGEAAGAALHLTGTF